MYRSLLVPLDRSSFAERALPLALSIARRAGARLDLVEVHALYALKDYTAGWVSFEPERDAADQAQEQLYLDATATWAASVSAVPITARVLAGSTVLPTTVADSILERARTGGTDLIVMSTHGRGPLSRFGIGSVANELIRRAPMPVLLVPPSDQGSDLIPEPVVDNVLIPLDGSARAEQVLQPALDLARLLEARCSLLQVIECRRHTGDPGSVAKAEAYLEYAAGKLRQQGLPVKTRVIVGRHTAEVIVEEGRAQPNSLIALATHGRGGLKRLLLGSVAGQLIRSAVSPVFVYPPNGKES